MGRTKPALGEQARAHIARTMGGRIPSILEG